MRIDIKYAILFLCRSFLCTDLSASSSVSLTWDAESVLGALLLLLFTEEVEHRLNRWQSIRGARDISHFRTDGGLLRTDLTKLGAYLPLSILEPGMAGLQCSNSIFKATSLSSGGR